MPYGVLQRSNELRPVLMRRRTASRGYHKEMESIKFGCVLEEHWDTGHPPSPPPPPLSTTTYITLVGDANTSLDVARLLLSDADKPSPLDIPVEVIDRLKSSSIRHIDIVSRHGPSQVSFKAKGLCELLNLPAASIDPISSQIFPRQDHHAKTPEFSPFFPKVLKIHLEVHRRRFPFDFSDDIPQSSLSSCCTIMYDLNTADNMYGEPFQVQFGLEK
ncbi:hypothetical protein BS47DRAFT_188329 [Hydnum rufescens UP504]|uniref:Uncharacterized protein n=1 Tax=Hydnum rufescens UP504 TaxID=1448309 RepID=A0A9P6AQB4_9AGAM|nr:hypothetical protein BS47DRAFT_188329 [Hydnum rufescens UP504]